jgi:Mannosyl-glycoprotein endo-beta-N-acetylglucosaminidase
MAKQDFYAMYMPQAQAAAAELNVPAEAILNQWGLETGWGKSVIPGTNNLGNIKSTNGKGVVATDNITGSREPYRQYASPDEFVQDYTRLIKTRYPQAVGSKDALAFGTALKAGGYAEDPNYARKVAGMPVESTSTSALPGARAAYDREDPASIYQFMMQNSRDIPVQQLTPEQREMMLQDRQQRASMLPLAIGASMSGDKRMHGVGAALMKDASSARGPMEVEGGYMLPDGSFIENPIAATNREENRQNRALQLAVQSAQNALNKRLGNEMTFQQTGYTPDGQQIVTNRTGMNYTLSQGPDGQPVYTPYSGASVPKATWDKNVQAVQEASASADRSDKIIKQVEQNPDAFSMTAGAISYLPQFAQGRAAKLLLDDKALETRTNVLRQAAQEISSLYGAALSLGEQQRANTFIPNEKDPPEIVMEKLKAARDWARTTAGQYGTGVSNAAAARTGAPAAPAGALSKDEEAELAQLRQRFKGSPQVGGQ